MMWARIKEIYKPYTKRDVYEFEVGTYDANKGQGEIMMIVNAKTGPALMSYVVEGKVVKVIKAVSVTPDTRNENLFFDFWHFEDIELSTKQSATPVEKPATPSQT